MLEKFASNLIASHLGQYIDNLDRSQVRVSLWGGDVNLKDLKLKKSALQGTQLPITIKEGKIGNLRVKIPWTRLRSEAVQIEIRDVVIIVQPKSAAAYDPEVEKASEQELKMGQLHAYEISRTTEEKLQAAAKGEIIDENVDEDEEESGSDDDDHEGDSSACSSGSNFSSCKSDGSEDSAPAAGTSPKSKKSPNSPKTKSKGKKGDDSARANDESVAAIASEAAKNDSFTARLKATMINNVQVLLKNVSIVYEDLVTDPRQPIFLTVRLDEFCVQSCNSSYQSQFVDVQKDPTLLHKLVDLSGLRASVEYFTLRNRADAQELSRTVDDVLAETVKVSGKDSKPSGRHLLHPMSGQLRVQYQPIPVHQNVPKWLIGATLKKTRLEVDRRQWDCVWRSVRYIEQYDDIKHFLKFKPNDGSTPRTNPTAWWNYAIQSTLFVVQRDTRRGKFDWNTFIHRKRLQREYIDLHKRKQNCEWLLPFSDETDLPRYNQIEEELPFDMLKVARKIAYARIQMEEIQHKSKIAYTQALEEHRRGDGTTAHTKTATSTGHGGEDTGSASTTTTATTTTTTASTVTPKPDGWWSWMTRTGGYEAPKPRDILQETSKEDEERAFKELMEEKQRKANAKNAAILNMKGAGGGEDGGDNQPVSSTGSTSGVDTVGGVSSSLDVTRDEAEKLIGIIDADKWNAEQRAILAREFGLDDWDEHQSNASGGGSPRGSPKGGASKHVAKKSNTGSSSNSGGLAATNLFGELVNNNDPLLRYKDVQLPRSTSREGSTVSMAANIEIQLVSVELLDYLGNPFGFFSVKGIHFKFVSSLKNTFSTLFTVESARILDASNASSRPILMSTPKRNPARRYMNTLEMAQAQKHRHKHHHHHHHEKDGDTGGLEGNATNAASLEDKSVPYYLRLDNLPPVDAMMSIRFSKLDTDTSDGLQYRAYVDAAPMDMCFAVPWLQQCVSFWGVKTALLGNMKSSSEAAGQQAVASMNPLAQLIMKVERKKTTQLEVNLHSLNVVVPEARMYARNRSTSGANNNTTYTTSPPPSDGGYSALVQQECCFIMAYMSISNDPWFSMERSALLKSLRGVAGKKSAAGAEPQSPTSVDAGVDWELPAAIRNDHFQDTYDIAVYGMRINCRYMDPTIRPPTTAVMLCHSILAPMDFHVQMKQSLVPDFTSVPQMSAELDTDELISLEGPRKMWLVLLNAVTMITEFFNNTSGRGSKLVEQGKVFRQGDSGETFHARVVGPSNKFIYEHDDQRTDQQQKMARPIPDVERFVEVTYGSLIAYHKERPSMPQCQLELRQNAFTLIEGDIGFVDAAYLKSNPTGNLLTSSTLCQDYPCPVTLYIHAGGARHDRRKLLPEARATFLKYNIPLLPSLPHQREAVEFCLSVLVSTHKISASEQKDIEQAYSVVEECFHTNQCQALTLCFSSNEERNRFATAIYRSASATGFVQASVHHATHRQKSAPTLAAQNQKQFGLGMTMRRGMRMSVIEAPVSKEERERMELYRQKDNPNTGGYKGNNNGATTGKDEDSSSSIHTSELYMEGRGGYGETTSKSNNTNSISNQDNMERSGCFTANIPPEVLMNEAPRHHSEPVMATLDMRDHVTAGMSIHVFKKVMYLRADSISMFGSKPAVGANSFVKCGSTLQGGEGGSTNKKKESTNEFTSDSNTFSSTSTRGEDDETFSSFSKQVRHFLSKIVDEAKKAQTEAEKEGTTNSTTSHDANGNNRGMNGGFGPIPPEVAEHEASNTIHAARKFADETTDPSTPFSKRAPLSVSVRQFFERRGARLPVMMHTITRGNNGDHDDDDHNNNVHESTFDDEGSYFESTYSTADSPPSLLNNQVKRSIPSALSNLFDPTGFVGARSQYSIEEASHSADAAEYHMMVELERVLCFHRPLSTSRPTGQDDDDLNTTNYEEEGTIPPHLVGTYLPFVNPHGPGSQCSFDFVSSWLPNVTSSMKLRTPNATTMKLNESLMRSMELFWDLMDTLTMRNLSQVNITGCRFAESYNLPTRHWRKLRIGLGGAYEDRNMARDDYLASKGLLPWSRDMLRQQTIQDLKNEIAAAGDDPHQHASTSDEQTTYQHYKQASLAFSSAKARLAAIESKEVGPPAPFNSTTLFDGTVMDVNLQGPVYLQGFHDYNAVDNLATPIHLKDGTMPVDPTAPPAAPPVAGQPPPPPIPTASFLSALPVMEFCAEEGMMVRYRSSEAMNETKLAVKRPILTLHKYVGRRREAALDATEEMSFAPNALRGAGEMYQIMMAPKSRRTVNLLTPGNGGAGSPKSGGGSPTYAGGGSAFPSSASQQRLDEDYDNFTSTSCSRPPLPSGTMTFSYRILYKPPNLSPQDWILLSPTDGSATSRTLNEKSRSRRAAKGKGFVMPDVSVNQSELNTTGVHFTHFMGVHVESVQLCYSQTSLWTLLEFFTNGFASRAAFVTSRPPLRLNSDVEARRWSWKHLRAFLSAERSGGQLPLLSSSSTDGTRYTSREKGTGRGMPTTFSFSMLHQHVELADVDAILPHSETKKADLIASMDNLSMWSDIGQTTEASASSDFASLDFGGLQVPPTRDTMTILRMKFSGMRVWAVSQPQLSFINKQNPKGSNPNTMQGSPVPTDSSNRRSMRLPPQSPAGNSGGSGIASPISKGSSSNLDSSISQQGNIVVIPDNSKSSSSAPPVVSALRRDPTAAPSEASSPVATRPRTKTVMVDVDATTYHTDPRDGRRLSSGAEPTQRSGRSRSVRYSIPPEYNNNTTENASGGPGSGSNTTAPRSVPAPSAQPLGDMLPPTFSTYLLNLTSLTEYMPIHSTGFRGLTSRDLQEIVSGLSLSFTIRWELYNPHKRLGDRRLEMVFDELMFHGSTKQLASIMDFTCGCFMEPWRPIYPHRPQTRKPFPIWSEWLKSHHDDLFRKHFSNISELSFQKDKTPLAYRFYEWLIGAERMCLHIKDPESRIRYIKNTAAVEAMQSSTAAAASSLHRDNNNEEGGTAGLTNDSIYVGSGGNNNASSPLTRGSFAGGNAAAIAASSAAASSGRPHPPAAATSPAVVRDPINIVLDLSKGVRTELLWKTDGSFRSRYSIGTIAGWDLSHGTLRSGVPEGGYFLDDPREVASSRRRFLRIDNSEKRKLLAKSNAAAAAESAAKQAGLDAPTNDANTIVSNQTDDPNVAGKEQVSSPPKTMSQHMMGDTVDPLASTMSASMSMGASSANFDSQPSGSFRPRRGVILPGGVASTAPPHLMGVDGDFPPSSATGSLRLTSGGGGSSSSASSGKGKGGSSRCLPKSFDPDMAAIDVWFGWTVGGPKEKEVFTLISVDTVDMQLIPKYLMDLRDSLFSVTMRNSCAPMLKWPVHTVGTKPPAWDPQTQQWTVRYEASISSTSVTILEDPRAKRPIPLFYITLAETYFRTLSSACAAFQTMRCTVGAVTSNGIVDSQQRLFPVIVPQSSANKDRPYLVEITKDSRVGLKGDVGCLWLFTPLKERLLKLRGALTHKAMVELTWLGTFAEEREDATAAVTHEDGSAATSSPVAANKAPSPSDNIQLTLHDPCIVIAEHDTLESDHKRGIIVNLGRMELSKKVAKDDTGYNDGDCGKKENNENDEDNDDISDSLRRRLPFDRKRKSDTDATVEQPKPTATPAQSLADLTIHYAFNFIRANVTSLHKRDHFLLRPANLTAHALMSLDGLTTTANVKVDGLIVDIAQDHYEAILRSVARHMIADEDNLVQGRRDQALAAAASSAGGGSGSGGVGGAISAKESSHSKDGAGGPKDSLTLVPGLSIRMYNKSTRTFYRKRLSTANLNPIANRAANSIEASAVSQDKPDLPGGGGAGDDDDTTSHSSTAPLPSARLALKEYPCKVLKLTVLWQKLHIRVHSEAVAVYLLINKMQLKTTQSKATIPRGFNGIVVERPVDDDKPIGSICEDLLVYSAQTSKTSHASAATTSITTSPSMLPNTPTTIPSSTTEVATDARNDGRVLIVPCAELSVQAEMHDIQLGVEGKRPLLMLASEDATKPLVGLMSTYDGEATYKVNLGTCRVVLEHEVVVNAVSFLYQPYRGIVLPKYGVSEVKVYKDNEKLTERLVLCQRTVARFSSSKYNHITLDCAGHEVHFIAGSSAKDAGTNNNSSADLTRPLVIVEPGLTVEFINGHIHLYGVPVENYVSTGNGSYVVVSPDRNNIVEYKSNKESQDGSKHRAEFADGSDVEVDDALLDDMDNTATSQFFNAMLVGSTDEYEAPTSPLLGPSSSSMVTGPVLLSKYDGGGSIPLTSLIEASGNTVQNSLAFTHSSTASEPDNTSSSSKHVLSGANLAKYAKAWPLVHPGTQLEQLQMLGRVPYPTLTRYTLEGSLQVVLPEGGENFVTPSRPGTSRALSVGLNLHLDYYIKTKPLDAPLLLPSPSITDFEASSLRHTNNSNNSGGSNPSAANIASTTCFVAVHPSHQRPLMYRPSEDLLHLNSPLLTSSVRNSGNGGYYDDTATTTSPNRRQASDDLIFGTTPSGTITGPTLEPHILPNASEWPLLATESCIVDLTNVAAECEYYDIGHFQRYDFGTLVTPWGLFLEIEGEQIRGSASLDAQDDMVALTPRHKLFKLRPEDLERLAGEVGGMVPMGLDSPAPLSVRSSASPLNASAYNNNNNPTITTTMSSSSKPRLVPLDEINAMWNFEPIPVARKVTLNANNPVDVRLRYGDFQLVSSSIEHAQRALGHVEAEVVGSLGAVATKDGDAVAEADNAARRVAALQDADQTGPGGRPLATVGPTTTISIDIPQISIFLVDDSRGTMTEYPLLSVVLYKIRTPTLLLTADATKAHISLETRIVYYNTYTGSWSPLLEHVHADFVLREVKNITAQDMLERKGIRKAGIHIKDMHLHMTPMFAEVAGRIIELKRRFDAGGGGTSSSSNTATTAGTIKDITPIAPPPLSASSSSQLAPSASMSLQRQQGAGGATTGAKKESFFAYTVSQQIGLPLTVGFAQDSEGRFPPARTISPKEHFNFNFPRIEGKEIMSSQRCVTIQVHDHAHVVNVDRVRVEHVPLRVGANIQPIAAEVSVKDGAKHVIFRTNIGFSNTLPFDVAVAGVGIVPRRNQDRTMVALDTMRRRCTFLPIIDQKCHEVSMGVAFDMLPHLYGQKFLCTSPIIGNGLAQQASYFVLRFDPYKRIPGCELLDCHATFEAPFSIVNNTGQPIDVGLHYRHQRPKSNTGRSFLPSFTEEFFFPHVATVSIETEEDFPVTQIDPFQDLYINVVCQQACGETLACVGNGDKKKSQNPVLIRSKNFDTRQHSLTLRDSRGEELVICISYVGSQVILYCPYWVVNQTQHYIQITTLSSKKKKDEAAAGTIEGEGIDPSCQQPFLVNTPKMMSSPENAHIYVKVGRHAAGGTLEWTPWSQLVPVNALGNMSVIYCGETNNEECTTLSYSVEFAGGALKDTRVIKITPRWIIINRCDKILALQQHRKDPGATLPPGHCHTLDSCILGQGCTLRVRHGEMTVNTDTAAGKTSQLDSPRKRSANLDSREGEVTSCTWTPAFSIEKLGDHALNVRFTVEQRGQERKESYVVHVSCYSRGSILFISIDKPERPPHLIENRTQFVVHAKQKDHTRAEQLSVYPRTTSGFVWDDVTSPPVLTMWASEGMASSRAITVNLEPGVLVKRLWSKWRQAIVLPGGVQLHVRVRSFGGTYALSVTLDNIIDKSWFLPFPQYKYQIQVDSINLLAAEEGKDIMLVTVGFEGGIKAAFSQGPVDKENPDEGDQQTFEVSIGLVQIADERRDAKKEVVLQTLERGVSTFSVSRRLQRTTPMLLLQSVQATMQPLTIHLEDSFLFAIIKLVERYAFAAGRKVENNKISSFPLTPWHTELSVPITSQDSIQNRMTFIEKLFISEFIISVSLYRGQSTDDPIRERLGFLSILIRSVKDARFDWRCIDYDNIYDRLWLLGTFISNYYSSELQRQLLNVVHVAGLDYMRGFVTDLLEGYFASSAPVHLDRTAILVSRRRQIKFKETTNDIQDFNDDDDDSWAMTTLQTETGTLTVSNPRNDMVGSHHDGGDSDHQTIGLVQVRTVEKGLLGKKTKELITMEEYARRTTWTEFCETVTPAELHQFGHYALRQHLRTRNFRDTTHPSACRRCSEMDMLRQERFDADCLSVLPHPAGGSLEWCELVHHVSWDEFVGLCSPQEVHRFANLLKEGVVGAPVNVVRIDSSVEWILRQGAVTIHDGDGTSSGNAAAAATAAAEAENASDVNFAMSTTRLAPKVQKK